MRIIFLALSLCIYLSAQTLEDKVNGFVGTDKKNTKSLSAYLFNNELKYQKADGSVNSILVLKTLSDNNLLDLYSKEPQDLELVFTTEHSPLVLIRVITESLNSMGYNFFLTKQILRTPEEFLWKISLSTQNVPNPLLLSETLREHGCIVDDISKDKNIWSYKIDSGNAKINALEMKSRQKNYLKKSLVPYMIAINGGTTSSVTIEANTADHWYPKVILFDDKLYVIQNIESDDRERYIKLKLPKNTAYIQVGDRYTMDNIKRGLAFLGE